MKKIHQITQENKKKIDRHGIGVHIFRILHPKLLIYLTFRSLNIVSGTNEAKFCSQNVFLQKFEYDLHFKKEFEVEFLS